MQYIVWYHGEHNLYADDLESLLPETAHVIAQQADAFLVEAECCCVLTKALQPEKDWTIIPGQTTRSS